MPKIYEISDLRYFGVPNRVTVLNMNMDMDIPKCQMIRNVTRLLRVPPDYLTLRHIKEISNLFN